MLRMPSLRLRIRCKSKPLPCETPLQHTGGRAKKQSGQRRQGGCKGTPGEALRVAVRGGLIPKARRPFQLYLHHMWGQVAQESSREKVRAISEQWRCLEPVDKDTWRLMAQKECQHQKTVAQELGLLPAGSQPSHGRSAFMNVGPYHCQQREGSGTYGMVVRGVDRESGRLVAIKLSKEGKEDLRHELSIYNELADSEGTRAGFFLRVVGHNLHAPIPWVAFPLAGTSLCRLVQRGGPMSGPDAMAVVRQLILGLGHLHQAGVAHLDMKSTNVLWEQSTRKLCIVDFGMSQSMPLVDGAILGEEYCAELYRPVELWSWTSDLRATLSLAVDLWGMACIVYEAFAGEFLMVAFCRWAGPPSCKDAIKVWANHHPRLCGSPMFRRRLHNAGLQHLIWSCLHPDPACRPKLQQGSDVSKLLRDLDRDGGCSPVPELWDSN